MPPQRSIIVDRTKMLQTIASLTAEQHADAMDRTRTWGDFHRTKALNEAQWVRRNVKRFAGRLLTPSEAKRWQQAIVEMGVEGLVDLSPSHVRLTDAGRAALEASLDA
jgi:hypothetical protein